MKNRVQKLLLANPLTYKEEEFDFNGLLRKILLSPAGTDGFIHFKFVFSDSGAMFSRLSSGIKSPMTEEEKETIEHGLTPIIRSDEKVSIPAGKYYFEQYPDLSEEQLLTRTLASLISIGSGNEIYVRLYKENFLETVMQAFRPI